MISLKMITVAQSAVVAKDTNNLSVFNIFTEMRSATFPAMIAQVALVAVTERDPGEDPDTIELRLRITAGRKVLGQIPIRVEYQDRKRNNLIAQVAGLVVPQPGPVRFSLHYGKRRLGFHVIEVISESELAVVSTSQTS